MDIWDTAIIGSGPAGLTAAIYTTRGAASTLLLGGEKWGGQLMLTTIIDNFPGFPEGVEGPNLMLSMRKQAERFGARVFQKNVTKADFSKFPLKLFSGEEVFQAKTVIIATGAETNWLNVAGEQKLIGRGISSCAPCDAPFFKNKKVAVIGGGDSAMEEALVMVKYAAEVTIIHRRNEFKASQIMQEKVKSNPKIKIIWNSEVVSVFGENKLEKMLLKNSETGQTSEFSFDGMFVAIGHTPTSAIFEGIIDRDEKGFIVNKTIKGYSTGTNIPGVFVAGDVHDHQYKQAVTAAGYGCMAAMEVLKYIEEELSS